MSFKQSVLLPLKEYNKLLSVGNKCNGKEDILMNNTIPSEIKLRLREQDRILGLKKPLKPVKVSLDKQSLKSLGGGQETKKEKTLKKMESNNETTRENTGEEDIVDKEINDKVRDKEDKVNDKEQEVNTDISSQDSDEFLDAIDDRDGGNENKTQKVSKTNYNKPKRVYETRSRGSMLTKSKRAKLSDLGKKVWILIINFLSNTQ